MHRYWDSIIEPIINMICPKSIIEVGSESGKSTARLLEYCSRHQSKLYSIDPFPNFDADDWVKKHSKSFVFHRSLSLDALPLIDNFDLIFIDGDHNWYTVFNELKLIEDKCRKDKKEFPSIFFHDIGWPYGRRDLYYNPDNIPEKYQKPYKKKGMVPGTIELVDQGGLNADMCNAVNENDQQNGVLTAVEDFLAQTSFELELITIPGLYGLGILIPLSLLENNHQLDRFISKIKIDPALRTLIEKIETDRILKQLAVNRRDDELELVKQKVETIVNNHKLTDQKQQAIIEDKQLVIEDLKKQLNQTVKKVQFRDEKIKILHKYVERFENDFFAMLESRRWKIGNAIGEVLQRIMFKKKAPMAFENVQKTFREYQNWKTGETPDNKKSDNSYLSHNFLKSQCNKLISLKVVDQSLKAFSEKIISIIVPIYNAYDETQKCIESILEYTTIPYQLILINDCSPDDRINELLNQYKDFSFIQVVENSQNLGFVKTVNIGMKKAKGDVVLLNSDTIVTSRWLQKLLLAACSDSKIATVTPFSNASGAFSVPEIGKNEEIVPDLTICGMAHIVERVSDLTYPRVPTGNGFCMYIKKEVMDEIGLFDEENFNRGYGEENDFCMRALKKGWQHIIDDSTFIYHKNSASFSADKDKLIKENRKVLDRLHPEYTSHVRKFIASPVLKNIRENIKNAMEKQRGNKRADALRILYVMHEGTGGTPATNQDLMQNISQNHECFLLTSTSAHLIVRYVERDLITQIVRYKLSDSWSARNFKSDEFRAIYFSLLVNLKIDIVHIRHLFKHNFELPLICRRLGLGVVFSFHDFYHVCPSIHLLDQDDKYCNGECRGTGQCRISTPLLKDLPKLREFLPEWQKAVSGIIDVCDTFVTTSEFTKKVYVNAYPELKNKRFKVIEHGRDFIEGLKECHTIPDSKSKIKILITGNIEIHKGSRFIKQLHDQDHDGRIEFHFLGTIPKELEGCGINHGTFERENFYNEVAKISPSFIGIFSIWPETFCHTLTEAWACGIPVLAFNIGTVADRVLHHDAGWFLDMEDAKASYDLIIDIAEKPFEYEKVLSRVKKIRFKTTREMADEYLTEYHRIMLAGKGKRQHKTIALYTPHGSNGFPGSSHVRCLLPMQHPDFSKRFLLKIMTDNADLFSVDYVMIQRDAVTGDALEKVLSWCKENNVPLVYEIDDNFMGIDRSHPEYDAYRPKIEAVEKLCRNADLITVSTPELEKNVLKYQSNIQVVKNALDENLWFSPIHQVKKKKPANVINVGYMGTYTHGGDIAILDRVIPEVKSIMADEHGITMEFFMIGGLKDKLLGSSWYKRTRIPGSDSEYPKFVKWLRQNAEWDIALAPLENNGLNKSKSALKFLEYTALGAAGIYSDVGGYSSAVKHLENGLLIQDNNIESWKSSLIKLALDKKLREKIVGRARADVVSRHLLKQRVVEWISAFDNVQPGTK